MKCVVNWIPLRMRNTQPHLKGLLVHFQKASFSKEFQSEFHGVNKTHSTPRFVKFQSQEDTVYFAVKFPDYWGVRKRVSSFQNLLDFWGRKRTKQFSILLDCSIQEQSYLRLIVFDHVCLKRSNLICRRRAPVRCWWRQTHVYWWTQMLDTTTEPHMYSKFIDTWNMQICGEFSEHPSLEWPWILYHLLFWFGSVEIAQIYVVWRKICVVCRL